MSRLSSGISRSSQSHSSSAPTVSTAADIQQIHQMQHLQQMQQMQQMQMQQMLGSAFPLTATARLQFRGGHAGGLGGGGIGHYITSAPAPSIKVLDDEDDEGETDEDDDEDAADSSGLGKKCSTKWSKQEVKYSRL
jgi:hypothetical protein